MRALGFLSADGEQVTITNEAVLYTAVKGPL